MNLYWTRLRCVAPAVLALVIVARVLAAGASGTQGVDNTEAAFLRENDLAMSRMMAAMKIKPSGDVDRDFVAAMIPHHQGAIEMAQAELRHGRNEQLRRIAQEIIVDQTQEIAAMRLALGEGVPAQGTGPARPQQ
jgi:uncharacterized protein (DUF305 family)